MGNSLELFIDLHDMCMPLGVFWSCWSLFRAKCPCVVDAQMCNLFLGCVVGAGLFLNFCFLGCGMSTCLYGMICCKMS